MKGYVNGEGYMGYVNGSYMLFASEEDYWEYMEDGSNGLQGATSGIKKQVV